MVGGRENFTIENQNNNKESSALKNVGDKGSFSTSQSIRHESVASKNKSVSFKAADVNDSVKQKTPSTARKSFMSNSSVSARSGRLLNNTVLSSFRGFRTSEIETAMKKKNDGTIQEKRVLRSNSNK